MPRAVTRAVSSSFAAPSSHSRGASLDIPSGNSSSARDMFPSPRPSKLSSSSSSSRPKASSSSPSTRRYNKMADSIDEPHTPPPPTRPAKEKKTRQKRPAAAEDDEDCLKEGDAIRGKVAKMPERQVSTFLANYDLEAEDRLRRAKQALQVSIESARAQMIASIYAYPRNVLSMRIEDYLCPPLLPLDPTSSSSKDKKSDKITKRQSGQQGMTMIAPIAPITTTSNRAPRKARSGEIVYSARGSPILLHRRSKGGPQKPDPISDEDEEEEEPFFDTASDNSISSESFSLPDEAAYTAQVMEQERNRMLSSEGYFPRSSSIFHRTSSSS